MKKEVIFTKDAPMPKGPYSQAIKAGNLLFVSGQAAIDPKTGKFLAPDDIETQTDIVMKSIDLILKKAGTSLDSVVKSGIFIDDIGKFEKFNNVYKKYFTQDPPARTTVEVGHFFKGMCIEIDVIALIPE
ncbi:MAG: Rid family detoxifying hydrolase [Desulfobacteraceae bacterium]|nr:Rid family detoxifying hydrolase [Desulfobacteraceae bacterium]